MATNIINNYRDLTIGKYVDILTISKSDAEEIDKQIRILSILSGMTENEILDLPIAEYKHMVVESLFLESATDDLHMRIAKVYKCKNYDLVPVSNLRNITTAQYIDFQTFIAGSDENIIHVLSCFLIPKGKTYGHDYDIIDVKMAIADSMSVADAVSLYAFFFASFKNLIRDSLTFSMSEAKRIKNPATRERTMKRIQEQMTILSNVGVGSLT